MGLLDAVKKDWEKGAKPLTPEQTARIKGNGKADALYSTGMAGIDTRNLQASQAGVWGDALAGNYGRMLASGAGSFGGAAGVAGSLAGDIGGGLARAGGWQKQAEGAAQTAGNEHARAGIMKGAEAQGDAMNLQNAARSGELADSAIAADSAFESGMQGIDASGIEGSGNMERNLKYGKSRSEAARDMEHAMTGQEAQGLGDSLVQSFDDLSQSKAGATQTAFSGSLAGLSAGLTEQYRQTGAELAGLQPSHLDETQVNEAALLAAEQNPAPGEEPGAQAPAEADVDMANRQTVMDEEARMAEQTAAAQAREQTAPEPPEAPAAPEPPQAPAANAQDHYNALEAFLRVKVRSRDELAGKMAELGIDDTDLQQKIQQATVSGSGWRDRLKAALGAG